MAILDTIMKNDDTALDYHTYHFITRMSELEGTVLNYISKADKKVKS